MNTGPYVPKITEYTPTEKVLKILGNRIAHERIKRGYTQMEFVKRLKLNRPTLGSVERGGPITLKTFIQVLRGLGFLARMDDLVDPNPQYLKKLKAAVKRRKIAWEGRIPIPPAPKPEYGESMSDTLEFKEPHPAAYAAKTFIAKHMTAEIEEALASTSLSGNRGAEISYGTYKRMLRGELVSDRYVLGLAWFLREILMAGGRVKS